MAIAWAAVIALALGGLLRLTSVQPLPKVTSTLAVCAGEHCCDCVCCHPSTGAWGDAVKLGRLRDFNPPVEPSITQTVFQRPQLLGRAQPARFSIYALGPACTSLLKLKSLLIV